MKKNRLILAFAAVIVLSAAALAAAIAVPQPAKNYTTMREMYEDLYENINMATICSSYGGFSSVAKSADTIVIVKADDELAAENSNNYETGKSFFYAESTRSVTTIEFIKNERGFETVTEIIDRNGLAEDGTLLVEENCWPLQKDCCYVLFLENGKKTIGWQQSKIDLTNLGLNGYKNQVVSVLTQWDMLEYVSGPENCAELMEGFLEADYISGPSYAYYEESYGGLDWQPIILTTEYTDEGMELIIEYAEDEKNNRILYKADTLIYA